jgi:hypothetical protein
MLGSSDGDVKAIVRYAARPKLLALYALFYVGNWLSHFIMDPTVHEWLLGPNPATTSGDLLGFLLFVFGPITFVVQIIGNLVMGVSIIGIIRVLIAERDELIDDLVDIEEDDGGDAATESAGDAEAA